MSTTDQPAAPATITSLAALVAAYPQLCGELQTTARTEGASAERARILGIEANALPGHEALVTSMKADSSVTPDIAAGRILGAERKLRGDAAQAIRDVETATSVVRSAPVTGAPPPAGGEKATTPDGWKAEYAASAALQREFAEAGDYVAFKANESKVRVLGARKSA